MRFTNGIHLGKVFGIPILVNPSWFLVLALVVFVLGGHFSREFPYWNTWAAWTAAVLTGLLFFASVLAHELCHSLIAVRKGIPVRGITLFMLGGVSQISHEASHPGSELLIAFAGPFCSLVLGAAFFGAAFLLNGVHDGVWGVLQQLAVTNLALGVFNLAPAFPLDGGRVLRAALWSILRSYGRATVIAGRLSQGLAGAMIAGGLALAVWATPFSGLWIALIGWFVLTSATSALRRQRMDDVLRSLSARDVMAPLPPPLPQDATAADAASRLLAPPTSPCLLVSTHSPVAGVFSLDTLRGLPHARWASTAASSLATPVHQLHAVAPTDPASRAAESLAGAPGGVVLVIDEGLPVGAVSEATISQRLRAMEALGIVRR